MLAGFILGISVGIFISGFIYMFMDCKMHEQKNKFYTLKKYK